MRRLILFGFALLMVTVQLAKSQSPVQVDSTIVLKPLVAVKFAPFGLLSPDINLEFQMEYFTKNNSSFELGYGFGNNTTFRESDRAFTKLYRAEYKRYLRQFTSQRSSAPFFATEFTFKKVLINKVGYKKTSDNTFDPESPIKYQLDVNFAAARLKYGFTYFNKVGLPVFSSFIGLGVGYFNNLEIGLPMDYTRGNDIGSNIFERSEGTRTSLSLTAGVAVGAGFFRKR